MNNNVKCEIPAEMCDEVVADLPKEIDEVKELSNFCQELYNQWIHGSDGCMYSLSDFKTWQLVLELLRRKGVYAERIEPCEKVKVTVRSGPAIVLVVTEEAADTNLDIETPMSEERTEP